MLGVVAADHVAPDRRGERAAGGAGRDRHRLVEAHPHARNDLGRHPDEPRIGVVVRRARFSRDLDAIGHVAPHRRRRAARHDVAHHVAHDERNARIEHRVAHGTPLRVHDAAGYLTMRWMKRGVTEEPSLSNVAYAATRSSGRTADAPIALDGYGAIGVVMPSACASATIESIPSAMPELHGDRIARARERVAQRHGAEELSVVVPRAIDAVAVERNRDRRVDTIELAVSVSAIAARTRSA